jgi:hypothetical protein
MKLKQEGLTKMGKEIFNKDPIFPQSSKKELAACSKLTELTPESAELTPQSAKPTPVSTEPTSPVFAILADPKLVKPTPESAKLTFSGPGASGVSPVDLAPAVIDLTSTGVEKLSRGQAIFKKPADHVKTPQATTCEGLH